MKTKDENNMKSNHKPTNRCGDCGKPTYAFYCPECTQKRITGDMAKRQGRNVPDKTIQRFGSDQDIRLTVSRFRTETGQRGFLIAMGEEKLAITLRSAVDLINKLGKEITDEFADMMLLFMREPPE